MAEPDVQLVLNLGIDGRDTHLGGLGEDLDQRRQDVEPTGPGGEFEIAVRDTKADG